VLPEALGLTQPRSAADEFEKFGADIIAEVSHPSISVKYGPRFVRAANFFVGSPTAFADTAYETYVRVSRAAGECVCACVCGDPAAIG
jgi:hypothetical protein